MSFYNEIIKTDDVNINKFKLLYNELLLMHEENYIKNNEKISCKVIELIVEFLVYSEKKSNKEINNDESDK